MAIHFSGQDWQRVREHHRQWWEGTLGRPLIVASVHGYPPDRPPPALGGSLIEAAYNPAIEAGAIVDAWDYALAGQRWLADGFPTVRPNLGPGCNTAFLGARTKVTPETVWFSPQRQLPLAEIAFRLDPDNWLFRRALAIYGAALDRWQGQVCVGTCDLTPNLDILAAFRDPEDLLCDLLEEPAQIDRLLAESGDAFAGHFEAIHRLLQPRNGGYTCWVGIHSEEPFYVLQSDLSYAIGPALFQRFVLPDLRRHCRSLSRSLYHLDGVGQLPHLDLLLGIDELDGIQWIPGAGAPPMTAWPEVYRRIRQAGKLVQIYGDLDTLRTIADQVGSADGICLITSVARGEEERFLAAAAEFGAG